MDGSDVGSCPRRNQMFEILITAGADVNLKNIDGQTALFLAFVYCSDICMKTLIQAGADVNVQDNRGWTPLIAVADCQREHCIEPLVLAGANVNIADNRGWGVLHYAARYNRLNEITSCFESFISVGADVNLADPDGTTPMHLLLQLWPSCPSTKTYVKQVLAAGANVNMVNNEGTFIDLLNSYYTINKHQASSLKLLFAAGDKITEPSDEVKRVLHEASKCLKHLCRETIRNHLLELDRHTHLFGRVPRLGLPDALQSYLLYHQTLGDDADDADDDSNPIT